MMKRCFVPALLLACAVGTARAGPVGSVALSDNAITTTDTGDINSATMFTFGDLESSLGGQGIFSGMPHQFFGSTSLTVGSPTSMTFGNATFGTFASTAITESINMPGVVVLYVLGGYDPGTVDSGDSGTSFPASFTISFTQNPAQTGTISGSGTFAVPPAAPPGVPEPATLAMGLTSIVGGIFFHLLRRRRSRKATA